MDTMKLQRIIQIINKEHKIQDYKMQPNGLHNNVIQMRFNPFSRYYEVYKYNPRDQIVHVLFEFEEKREAVRVHDWLQKIREYDLIHRKSDQGLLKKNRRKDMPARSLLRYKKERSEH